jgi:hypothetical protein
MAGPQPDTLLTAAVSFLSLSFVPEGHLCKHHWLGTEETKIRDETQGDGMSFPHGRSSPELPGRAKEPSGVLTPGVSLPATALPGIERAASLSTSLTGECVD